MAKPANTSPGPASTRIVALAGGIGAARFLRGLQACARPDAPLEITVIGNTGDDITLYGLRICPDLDTVMYTLGGGIEPEQGWGRSDETWHALEEVRAYGDATQPGTQVPVVESWFGLGDRDVGTHLVRTAMLADGATLSQVTASLCARWQPGVRLLPMSDQPVASHVEVEDPTEPTGRRLMHFQEYWVRLHAELPAVAVRYEGIEAARPAPGVLDAIAAADVVLFPPSNPVVSIGTILAVPGIADAVRAAKAPVVGVSPVIAGAPVRGMADKLLPSVGVDTSAVGIGRHYGARAHGGVIDGWLVDTADAGGVEQLRAAGLAALARPLWMTDVAASAEIAAAALALAGELAGV
jgi:LPPG:FO 2-phospho-L-lactate transferase